MRPVVWFTAIAAVVALLWLLSRGDAASPPGGAGIAASPAPVAAEQVSDAGQSSPSSRHAAVTVEAAEGDARRRVRVVATMPNGDRAAGATVRFALQPEEHRSPWGKWEDLETRLTASGSSAVADAEGVAAIVVAAPSRLCVRSGAFYQETRVEADDDEVCVALERDVTIAVQVVDEDGRPREQFDVELEVRASTRLDGQQQHSVDLPSTDSRGLTALAHAQREVTLPGAEVLDWRMVLRSDFGPVVERQVPAAQIDGATPLVLRVPSGGAIALDVQGAAGSWIWAAVSLHDTASELEIEDDRLDGVSWFRQVPLGRNWRLEVKAFGEVVRREIAGPTTVDEIVRVQIALPLRELSLRGRVVRKDGIAVPGAKIRFTGSPAQFFHETTESRDGSLDGRIGDFHFHGALPAAVDKVTAATLRIERDGYCVPTTIALPPLHAGENDLGDVVVPAPDGELQLASVAVRRAGRDVTADASARLQDAGAKGINRVPFFEAHRGDRITFHGPATSLPLEVIAWCAGSVTRRVPVRLGEHVVVDLEPSASLRVRATWPRVPAFLRKAELADVSGRSDGGYFREVDGFAWRDLEPGRYRLRLIVGDQLVHEVPDLELTAGANVLPRSGALDLSRAAQAFQVAIRARDGGEVEWPKWWLLPAVTAAPTPEGTTATRLERGWFVVRPDPVAIAVAAEGFVPRLVPTPTADLVVELERCTSLRIQPARGENVETEVNLVEDGLRDERLRALDDGNFHASVTLSPSDDVEELHCVPGTIVEIVVVRGGVSGPPQRVAIGRTPVEVVAQ